MEVPAGCKYQGLKTSSRPITGTVKEAARGPLQYEEKERWNMEKIKQHYKELLEKPLTQYLEIE